MRQVILNSRQENRTFSMVVQMYDVVNEIIYNTEAFFAQPVKNKQEAYEKLIEMSRNNDYTTRDLFGCLYHLKLL